MSPRSHHYCPRPTGIFLRNVGSTQNLGQGRFHEIPVVFNGKMQHHLLFYLRPTFYSCRVNGKVTLKVTSCSKHDSRVKRNESHLDGKNAEAAQSQSVHRATQKTLRRDVKAAANCET